MASKSRSSRATVARSSPTMPVTTAQRVGQAGGKAQTATDASATRPPAARASTAKGSTVKASAVKASASKASAGRGSAAARAKGQAEVASTRGTPIAPTWLQWLTFAFGILGLAVSAYLTYTHFTESKLLGCSESGLVNCEKVTTSAQSYVFGIPVAVLGLAFYAFAAPIMSPWAWRALPGTSPAAGGVLRAWRTFVRFIPPLRLTSVVIGVCFVLYLLYAELFIIGSICLYCTSVHIITFILFILVVFAAAAWGLRPARADMAQAGA
jgi:uncharacterized membrane protein